LSKLFLQTPALRRGFLFYFETGEMIASFNWYGTIISLLPVLLKTIDYCT